MKRSILLAASITMAMGVLSFAAPSVAQAGGGICCCFTCPDCACKLTAEEVEVEKSCFEVECKTICVPKVVFPWQTGKCCWLPWAKKSHCDSCDSCDGRGCDSCNACVNNGAVLRKVKVLKTKKYKCPECEYTWSADESCAGCCDGGCDSGCDGCCASNDSTTELPAMWKTAFAYQSSNSQGLGVVPVQAVKTSTSR